MTLGQQPLAAQRAESLMARLRAGEYLVRDTSRTQAHYEYARLRGLDQQQIHGGPGTWHRAAAEVFANDFRVLVAQVEPEFWPHPGVARPNDERAGGPIRTWWNEAAELCGLWSVA